MGGFTERAEVFQGDAHWLLSFWAAVLLHLLPVQNETAQHATYTTLQIGDMPHTTTRREAYVGATGGVRLTASGTDGVDHLLALSRGDPGHIVTDC